MTELNKDRLMKLGLLNSLREDLRLATNRAKGILGSLSDATFLLDPQDPFVIDGQKVRDYAGELFTCLIDGNKLKARIQALESELGM